MTAAWYERQGAARVVLKVAEQPRPEPAPGEVRLRVELSGIHAGGIGKRQGYWGSTMAFSRVIPHGDGVGVIDAVGDGVSRKRLGERVRVFLAQSYRPGGTAAEYTVIPTQHAVPLPDEVDGAQAAGLGIPGITGHRPVTRFGDLIGQKVLVAGAAGAVGRAAVAMARRAGATVLAAVRHDADVSTALEFGAHHDFVARADLQDQIEATVGPEAAEAVADLAFYENVDLACEVLRYGGSIAAYASGDPRPSIPFWPLAYKNITVRLLSNDDFPKDANQRAARDLTAALLAGDLRYEIRAKYPLRQVVEAHEAVESGGTSRVVVEL